MDEEFRVHLPGPSLTGMDPLHRQAPTRHNPLFGVATINCIYNKRYASLICRAAGHDPCIIPTFGGRKELISFISNHFIIYQKTATFGVGTSQDFFLYAIKDFQETSGMTTADNVYTQIHKHTPSRNAGP
jgi:hypothetical protein